MPVSNVWNCGVVEETFAVQIKSGSLLDVLSRGVVEVVMRGVGLSGG